MKRKDLEAIIGTIIDDDELIEHIYDIVKPQLPKQWRNDVRKTQQVIAHVVEEAIADLDLANIISKLLKKYHIRRKKKTLQSNDNHLQNSDNNNDIIDNIISNEAVTANTSIPRVPSYDEVKPTYSDTEPIQITSQPRKISEKKKKLIHAKTIPQITSRNHVTVLSNEEDSFSSASTIPLGTDEEYENHKYQMTEHNKNGNRNEMVGDHSLHVNSSEIITKSTSNSNDDQVLIQLSNEIPPSESIVAVHANNVQSNTNLSIQINIGNDHEMKIEQPKLSLTSPTMINDLDSKPRSPRPVSVSINNNDYSDRNHLLEHKSPRSESQLEASKVSEDFETSYENDFEDIVVDGHVNTEHLNDVSHQFRKVSFKIPIVTETNERDKCTREEISELFYTHDESIKFEHEYTKELERAEMLGLSWNDWIEQRNDDDIAREEMEEKNAQNKTKLMSDDGWDDSSVSDYNDDFEVGSNHSIDEYFTL